MMDVFILDYSMKAMKQLSILGYVYWYTPPPAEVFCKAHFFSQP